MTKFIQFFFSPTNNVEKLKAISNSGKIITIGVLTIISSLIATLVTGLGVLPLGFNTVAFIMSIILNLALNLILAFFILTIGKIGKNKVQGNFLDNLFFILVSFFISTLGIIATFLITKIGFEVWAWLGTIIFLGWALVLLSKSLSKLNNITETKVTFIVVGALIAIYMLNTFILFPFTGFSLI